MKHIWIDCVTPCVGVRWGGERRDRERDTEGEWAALCGKEQKAKVGKRRHPLKSLEPNWPANY